MGQNCRFACLAVILVSLLLGTYRCEVSASPSPFPCPRQTAEFVEQAWALDLNGNPMDPFYHPHGPYYIFPSLALFNQAAEQVVFQPQDMALIHQIQHIAYAVAPGTCVRLLRDFSPNAYSLVEILTGPLKGKRGYVDSAWLHWLSSDDYDNAVLATRSIKTSHSLQPTVAKLTSPIRHGATAQLSIETTPGATCYITVNYMSGPSHAHGLDPKIADQDGSVTWQWIVGTRTTPGEWPIDIACAKGGQRATLTVQLHVL